MSSLRPCGLGGNQVEQTCVDDFEIQSGGISDTNGRAVREEAESWAKEKPKNDEQTGLQVCRSEPPIRSSRLRLLTVDGSNGAVASPAAPLLTGRGVNFYCYCLP